MFQTLIINGSGRDSGSYCARLANVVESALRAREVDTRVIHLACNPLPMLDPEDPKQSEKASVSHFLDEVFSADSLVLVTPSYHNSFSGRLKNALDYLSMSTVGGKVCGLVCHAGGIKSTEPLAHLRGVTKSLRMITLITQICTNPDDFVSSEENFKNISVCEPVLHRVNDFVDELIMETSIRSLVAAARHA